MTTRQPSAWPPGSRTEIIAGLCSVSYRDLDPAAIVDLSVQAELAAIEWGADGHVPVGDLVAASAVAARCAEAGIECPSYGTYLGMDPAKDEPGAACATAAALGATNIRVWAPFGVDHTADAAGRAEATRQISEFADHADEQGLTVGIECHGWTLTDTAASARQLVADIGADHVYSYWQPNYWDDGVNRSPRRQLDELRILIPELSHLHVYWWIGMERRPLREGSETWLPVLDAARERGRWQGRRFAFLEFVPGDDATLLSRESATLRSWLREELRDPADTVDPVRTPAPAHHPEETRQWHPKSTCCTQPGP